MDFFEHKVEGPFNLVNQSKYFDNCVSMNCERGKVILSFPVEGAWRNYATVILTQPEQNLVAAEVESESKAVSSLAFKQALAIFSLDVDGSGWELIGSKDPVIRKLQEDYLYVRPTLFQSPYEAAVAFVIGNRMSIKQRQTIMADISAIEGYGIMIDGEMKYAFPSPYKLLEMKPGGLINDQKLQRLKNIAQAAINGILNRDYLRSLPIEMAIAQLKNINGIGEFYAQGILHRGAGIVNEITNDDLTPLAIQKAYHLPDLPSRKILNEITANWDPYKMWSAVLLHIWLRREVGLPAKRDFIAKIKA